LIAWLLRQGGIEINLIQRILRSCLLCGGGLWPTRSRRSPDLVGCDVAPIHCLVAAYLGVQHGRYRSALATFLAGRYPAAQVRRACLSCCSLRLLRRREYAQEQQEHSDGRTTQHQERLAFVLAELAACGSGLLGLPRLVKRLADDLAPLNPALSIRCLLDRGFIQIGS
jgi:hypothetical protein